MIRPHDRFDDDGDIEEPQSGRRVAPHDLDAEAAILSAIMLDAAAIDQVSGLRREHFYASANAIIFEAALWLSEQGRPVDILTIKSRLIDTGRLRDVGGEPYLAQLVDSIPFVAHLGEYVEIVRDKFVRRAVISICQKATAEGYITKESAAEYVDRTEQAIFEIARAKSETALEHVSEIQRRVFSKIVDQANRGMRITGIPTGFERLDGKTAGLHDGQLTIVAARPGMGKTSFVMNVAVNVASTRTHIDPQTHEQQTIDGVAVAIFSLEMAREELISRMLCSEGRVDSNKMRQGYLQDRDWNNLTQAGAYINQLPIWIDDTTEINHLEIRSRVRKLQAHVEREQALHGNPCKRVGLIVVDYVQLMKAFGENLKSRQQEIGNITRALKRISKELRVPVIALSQLNRAIESRGANGRRPQLSDLREAGDIEQDADNVIFIHRDDYYEREAETRGIAELIIAKQRSGPTGPVKVAWQEWCTRFDNLAPGDAPDDQDAA